MYLKHKKAEFVILSVAKDLSVQRATYSMKDSSLALRMTPQRFIVFFSGIS